MPNLAPLTKKFCELPLLKTIKNFWCRLSIEDLQILLSFLLALYRATWRKKKEIILKRLSVKPGVGVGSEVGVISFLEKDVLGLRLGLGLTLTPTLQQHALKKRYILPRPRLRPYVLLTPF